jgi:hypothetical protein
VIENFQFRYRFRPKFQFKYAFRFLFSSNFWFRLTFFSESNRKPKYIFYFDLKILLINEWGWTAQNSIARQSIGRHFWQEINCLTRNFSTAWIQLNRAELDSSRWQKYCKVLESRFKLLSTIFSYKLFYRNCSNFPLSTLKISNYVEQKSVE